MRVSLIRTEYGQTETVGLLVIDGRNTFATLEPPWRDNERSISCIPEGHYTCTKAVSTKHGAVFWVNNVAYRTDIILGHVGNTHRDSTGCVLYGMYPGRLEYTRAVMESKRAIAAWRAMTDGVDTLDLQIMGVRL